ARVVLHPAHEGRQPGPLGPGQPLDARPVGTHGHDLGPVRPRTRGVDLVEERLEIGTGSGDQHDETPGAFGHGLGSHGGALSRGASARSTAQRFVHSYECFGSPDTGKPTKRPTVSNDTGTPGGPRGTGAWPEGSVWEELIRERTGHQGNAARAPSVHGETDPGRRADGHAPAQP